MLKMQTGRLLKSSIGFPFHIGFADNGIKIFSLEGTFFLLIFAIKKQKDGIRFDTSAVRKNE